MRNSAPLRYRSLSSYTAEYFSYFLLKHFFSLSTLLLDEDTSFGISHLHTLQVVVFYRCIFVGFNLVNITGWYGECVLSQTNTGVELEDVNSAVFVN